MAAIFITNIVVQNNPSSFFTPLRFEIIFECIEELKGDLEWKMIYVGSAESEVYDQVLDTITVGPIPEGLHSFIFESDPPDAKRIPKEDAVGPTLVLLNCSYRDQEFVRVGYFINNDYAEAELRESPPEHPQFDKLVRNILATKPRVKRFPIDWGDTIKPDTIQLPDSTEMSDSDMNMEAEEDEPHNKEFELSDCSEAIGNGI